MRIHLHGPQRSVVFSRQLRGERIGERVVKVNSVSRRRRGRECVGEFGVIIWWERCDECVEMRLLCSVLFLLMYCNDVLTSRHTDRQTCSECYRVWFI